MFPVANSTLSFISILAVLQNFIPSEFRDFIRDSIEACWNRIRTRYNPYTTVEVHAELDGGFRTNDFYCEVEQYLGSLENWTHQIDNVRVHRSSDTKSLSFCLPPDETVEDTYKGAKMLWTHHATQKPVAQQQGWWESCGGRKTSSGESKSFSLKLLKTDRARLLREYFDHISKIAGELERRNSQRKLYTNEGDYWEAVDFKHPSIFETLALLPELKERIKSDLKAFSESERYYHSVGRAWKRGYLLYGPPGTGKSSMIAAMANFLHYDIYDLELTNVADNSILKTLLIRTTRKSIIVIEDIDCSLDLSDRAAKWADQAEKDPDPMESKPPSKVTLSGLLNFTDGLWSWCGEERIFVFTTNHKDRLDPALLRSGRMDFHILLSYCTFPAFKLLAANYLGLQEHELYRELEEEMRDNSKVTPAEVVELLISNKQKPDAALHKLMAALRLSPDQSSDVSFSVIEPLSNRVQRKRLLQRFSPFRKLNCTRTFRELK